jgi:hypothetical protein
VSVIARNLEARGIATVMLALVREHVVAIKPPRALYVPFPFGLAVGRPGRVEEQRAVLRRAFSLLDASSGPVLDDYPDDEHPDDEHSDGSPLQASMVHSNGPSIDLATEVTLMRRYWEEQWMPVHGRTAIGLSGVAVPRLRAVVRYLENYVEGKVAAPLDGRDDVALFVRHCVDDLRSLYTEARLASHPAEHTDDRARWLWGDTALGQFLPMLSAHMASSTDGDTRAVAYGIAR